MEFGFDYNFNPNGMSSNVDVGMGIYIVPENAKANPDQNWGVDMANFQGLAVWIFPNANKIAATYKTDVTNIGTPTISAGSFTDTFVIDCANTKIDQSDHISRRGSMVIQYDASNLVIAFENYMDQVITCNSSLPSDFSTALENGNYFVGTGGFGTDRVFYYSLYNFKVFTFENVATTTTVSESTISTATATQPTVSSTIMATSATSSAPANTALEQFLESGGTTTPPDIETIPAHPIPKTSVLDISQCRDVQPDIRAPPNNGSPTLVHVIFKVERFVAIDDVSETFSVIGTIMVSWYVDTCTELEIPETERVLTGNSDTLWTPHLHFTNAANSMSLHGDEYADDLEIVVTKNASKPMLIFYFSKTGTFQAKCPLDLGKFPFDGQQCRIEFALKQPSSMVKFQTVQLQSPSLSQYALWELQSSSSKIDIVKSVRNFSTSYVTIESQLTRKPEYYLVNKVAPSEMLLLLDLAAFLLPPEECDRTIFTVTILLALTVAQTEALKSVPQTSQRILMNDYLLILLMLTTFITIQSALACYLYHLSPAKLTKKLHCALGKITPLRIFNIVCLIFVILGVVCIHLYALAIINA